MYDRLRPSFRSRRIKPNRPQPPRMPRYIAVGLAGFFAIVPAQGLGNHASASADDAPITQPKPVATPAE